MEHSRSSSRHVDSLTVLANDALYCIEVNEMVARVSISYSLNSSSWHGTVGYVGAYPRLSVKPKEYSFENDSIVVTRDGNAPCEVLLPPGIRCVTSQSPISCAGNEYCVYWAVPLQKTNQQEMSKFAVVDPPRLPLLPFVSRLNDQVFVYYLLYDDRYSPSDVNYVGMTSHRVHRGRSN